MAQRQIPEKETISVEFKSDTKKLSDSEIIDTSRHSATRTAERFSLAWRMTGRQPESTKATRIRRDSPPSSQTRPYRPSPHASKPSDWTPAAASRRRRAGRNSRGAPFTSNRGLDRRRIMRRRQKADGSPESVPLYPYEIITRLSTIGQMDYSAFPAPDSSTDDLDPEEIQDSGASSRGTATQAITR